MNTVSHSLSSSPLDGLDDNIFKPLNLPTFSPRLRQSKDHVTIFDPLRNRHVKLTPEEWVRQHFVHFLIEYLHYPASLMGNEVSLKLNGMSRRCDTVVYDRHLVPCMIIEYKRPDVALTQKVFDQISRYNMTMHVNYLIVSNGFEHYCCRMDYEHKTYHFVPQLPSYDACTSSPEKRHAPDE